MNTIARPVQVGFSSRFNRYAKWLRLTPPVQLFLLAILMALNLGGGGRDPRGGSELLERVGSWPGFTRGPALSLAVTNHHAFVAIGEGGLAVLEVTDPAKPVRVGGFRPPGKTEQVRVIGQRAYLATCVHAGGGCEVEGWRGRLVILDVSDSPRPRFLGSFMTGSSIDSFVVSGNLVSLTLRHVVPYGPRLHIVDVTNPERPVPLFVGSGAGSVLWGGREQVFATDGSSWSILDLSQPASPVSVTTVSVTNVPGAAAAIRVVGERAYVLNSGALQIYDITAPHSPALLGQLDLVGGDDLQMAGNYAFVAADQTGVTVVDITNPRQPVSVGSWQRTGLTRIEVADGHAFVLDSLGGLQILDLSNVRNVVEVANFDTGLTAQIIRISGSRACLSSSDTPETTNRSRLEIIDISNPRDPALIEIHEGTWDGLMAMLPGLGFERDGAGPRVVDGYAYDNLGWEGFEISEVSSPTNVLRVGGFDTLGEVHDLWITNHYAYVAEGWQGLEVFDVSQPAQPFPIGRVSTRGQARGVRMAGNYAYVAEGGGGLAIFALAPGPVTIIEDPASLGVAVGDSATLSVRAYGRGPLSYQWYVGESGDVSRPVPGANRATYTTPALAEAATYWVRVSSAGSVSDSRTAWVRLVPPVSIELLSLWAVSPNQAATNVLDVAVSSNYAYVTHYKHETGDSGLTILDVSNPAQPVVQRVLSLPWSFYGFPLIAISSNRLYTTYQIFDLTNPVQPVLITNWPSVTIPSGPLLAVGDYLYLPGDGLDILDVRNPAAPIFLDHYSCMDIGPWEGGPVFAEQYAFWARGWAGMQILDLSVPTEPRHVSAYYPEAAVLDVGVLGSFAFITEGPEDPEYGDDLTGMEVIDISDLQRPVRAARISLPVANSIEMMGSYACVTGDGLQVFDVGDPYHPVRAGRHQLGAETKRLQVVGNLVYVAAGEYGLAIYRVVPQLKLNPPVREGNVLRLSWLGGPGIHLQEAVSLRDQDWRDVPNSEGMSSLLLSPTNTSSFFRLTKP